MQEMENFKIQTDRLVVWWELGPGRRIESNIHAVNNNNFIFLQGTSFEFRQKSVTMHLQLLFRCDVFACSIQHYLSV
jgi:hypothetical protein